MINRIRRAAVIGSGTMGGAIAAHLANVGIPVDLFDIVPRDLTPEEEAAGLTLEDPQVRYRIVNNGWQAVLNSRPAALYDQANAELARLGNLADDFDRLAQADWIIEVIIENLDIKRSLIARLEEVRQPHTIVSTNTSGIPIHDIADGFTEGFRQHFLGTHFFNPPRYLKLLEVIPHTDTLPDVLETVTRIGEDELGKGVVLCKDTPNFIGNRIFSMAGTYELLYALEHGYTVEEVDTIMGPLVGRPKTAVFRLLDLVGLDVMAHVNTNLYEAIEDDENREMLRDERASTLMETMLEKGWLGNKTGVGFYKRVETDSGREFWSLDFETMEHTPAEKVRFDSVGANRKLQPTGTRIKAMVEADDRAGQFVRHAIYNLVTYSAMRVPEITENLANIDRAMRWGFAHEMGPFEIWDAIGVSESVPHIEEAGFHVADWVKDMLAAGFDTFYAYDEGVATGRYDLESKTYVPFEEKPLQFNLQLAKAKDGLIASNGDANVIDMGDRVALFELTTKSYTLTPGVVEMAAEAIDRMGTDYDALVIGHEGNLFSGGANLDMMELQQAASSRGVTPAEIVEERVAHLQQMMLSFRYAPGPVVTAPFDRTLGGGAELTMSGDRIVAHAELYIGLVEAGLGLIPAATGTKELLRRVVNPHMRVKNADPLPVMQRVLEQIAFATVATSAEEGRNMGFLGPCDRIVTNRDQLLAQAKREALHMVHNNYRPPMPETIYAAGRDILAAIQTQVYLLVDAEYATEHDAVVTNKLAWVLCGGDLSEPTWVDEQYILDLEREAFVALVQEPKTIERIMHMLQTGKPLRN
ncbi:MAG: 3-hydroxyacyl-CoA dehydrogenase/enoyl-CoA hydratase family protein [Chloroflexi bacterium]|nr:3-hydroxyacyl-CoA dehydrogenase/enoyl-CoA hydratase family protein [Chloroflexota bacterium]